MKTEHYIFFPELVEQGVGTAKIRVNELDNYADEDIDIHLCITLLMQCGLLNESDYQNYIQAKNDYLYNNTLPLPSISYQGPLADQYTLLDLESAKLMADPDYRSHLTSQFNATYFGDPLPEGLPPIGSQQQVHSQIMAARHGVSCEIEAEIGAKISTIAWPRLQNYKFDQSLPATLLLELFQYNPLALAELNRVAAAFVTRFSVQKNEEDPDFCVWELTIEGNF